MSRAALAHDVKSAEGAKAKSAPSALRVNKPADAYEREANPVAEHAGPGAGHKALWSLSKVRMGSSPESAGPGPATQSNVPPIVHDALGSPGRPLDNSARGFFEQRFGRNFSQVRIHTGDDAAEAASLLHSSAFTLGNDIVFARDRYAPSTARGRLLLAHELRHVQQQQNAVRSPELAVDLPSSAHEVQARSLFDTDIKPVSSQRIQCAPESDQFALDGDIINSVGRQAFGDTSWAFLKAVIEGFVNGLKGDLQAGRGEEAKSHLHGLFVPWNAAKFYLGYLVGLVLGLISPITDLVKGIIGIIKLAGSALEWLAKWSPVGVAISPERQQKIAIITQRFSDLAVQFGNAIVEFAKDPKGSAKKFSDFLDTMMNLALAQARSMGASAAHSIFDFLKQDYYDMGESIGKVIGGLIVQVLLLVFSEAIGNLISEAASMIGKAAEFVAGKAVELFEWVASFASKVIGKIREAVNGALKLFKGLANSLIDAFDALKALFTESEELAGGLKTATAGGGDLGAVSKTPNVMESRMVTSTRTSPAKVEDLKPPKIHPSKAGEVTPPKTTPKVQEPAPKELAKPKVGGAEVDEKVPSAERELTKEQQGGAQRARSSASKVPANDNATPRPKIKIHKTSGNAWVTSEGTVGEPGTFKAVRSGPEQDVVAGHTGDDAGHRLAASQKGSPGRENLARQNRIMNRAGGTWRELETSFDDAVKQGFKVDRKVSDIYRPEDHGRVSWGDDFASELEKNPKNFRPYRRHAEWTLTDKYGNVERGELDFVNTKTPLVRELEAKKLPKTK